MSAVYLDYNAGAPVRPQAAAAVMAALAMAGNPSSIHGAGRAVRAVLENSREAVAALVGALPAGVVFTSGGTEANALALHGCARPRVLMSAIEHPSVLRAVPGAEIVPVDAEGRVRLDELERLLAADPRPTLVSLMLANNETGVIQPVAEAARIAHRAGALLHCDAAQGPGRMPNDVAWDMAALGADLLTLSSAKLGGPSGAGALVLADDALHLAPILRGGGQERWRRAGTENVSGISGFAAAAKVVADERVGNVTKNMLVLRDGLEAEARRRVPGAVVIAQQAGRLVNTSCLALPGVAAQTQLMALDLAGVMVSAGAACSSGKVAASHVLSAMGLGPEVAGCAIRVSLGWDSAPAHVERFLAAWVELARRKGCKVEDAAAPSWCGAA